eukprot:COSAG03_NODE_759_length_5968_cov_39.290169_3_plen_135_part_00
MLAYIGSLPRGEQKKAKDALRNYVYGPGKMQPDDAIERYKERRVRDAQAPIGATDFDELDASDSDAEDSDDDILGAGYTAEMGLIPFSPRYYETPDRHMRGAGLTVAGSGLFSYPGEDLISDGLGHLASAIHNI